MPAAGLPRKRAFMARNIVLCLDGISNQYAATNTNVVKLYTMLARVPASSLDTRTARTPPPGPASWPRPEREAPRTGWAGR